MPSTTPPARSPPVTSLAGTDGRLRRALDDEIDLARRLVIAMLALRYGDSVREAVRVVEHAEGARRALGVEALDVILTRAEAASHCRSCVATRASGGRRGGGARAEAGSRTSTDDPTASGAPWLATCARHAAVR